MVKTVVAMKRWVIVCLFILPIAAYAKTLSPTLQWQQPNEENLRLLSVHLDKIVFDDVITAYQNKGDLLVPLGMLSQILDLAITTYPDKGIAEGFILKENRHFYLDVSRSEVTIQGKIHSYLSELVVIYPDDIYVEINLLAKWLPIKVDADLFSLTLRLYGTEPFPIQHRIEREQRMEKARSRYLPDKRDYPKQELDYQMLSYPFIDQTIGLLVKRSDISEDSTNLTYTTYAAADLLYLETSFYLTGKGSNVDDYRLVMGRKDQDAGLLGLLNATEFSFGHLSIPSIDLVSTSKVSQPGFTVSNYPLSRQLNYDRHTFEGDLLPGWEVELYHNNLLLDFQQTPINGQYRFENVPLLFGNNYFRLVFYGPHGEIKEETFSFNVANALTKPGQHYYRISAVKDEQTNEEHSLLQYDIGLNKYLSANFNWLSLPLNHIRHDYVMIEGTGFWNSLFMNLNYIDDNKSGNAKEFGLQTKINNLNIKLNHAKFDNFENEIFQFTDSIVKRSELRLDTVIPPSFLPRLPITLEIDRDEFESGNTRTEFLNRISGNTRGLFISNELKMIKSSGHSESRNGVFQVSHHRTGTTTRGIFNYQLKPYSDLNSIELTYEGLNFGPYRMSMGITHFSNDEEQYSIGLNKRKGDYSLNINATYNTNGDATINAYTSMSLGHDPVTSHWRLDADSMANMGSISAVVFMDKNQNGIQDNGEEGIPNVGFEFNNTHRSYATDKQGKAFITQVIPNEAIDLAVALATLEDPLWVPAIKGVQITPRPGQVAIVYFPIIMTGEIDGTFFISRLGKISHAGNIELELLDQQGKVVNTTKTSYDGFYVMSQIPVGAYTLRISPEQIQKLGLAQIEPKLIKLSNDNMFISDIDFILSRKR